MNNKYIISTLSFYFLNIDRQLKDLVAHKLLSRLSQVYNLLGTTKSKVSTNLAKTILPSILAKCYPIQLLAPAPN